MSEAQPLYEMQSIDLEIEDIARAIERITEQLGETDEIKSARQTLTDAQDHLKTQQRTLRDLEGDLDEMGTKLKELERKLYGGTVKASKELGSLEHEVQLLRGKKSDTEDNVLTLMDEVESDKKSVETAKSAASEVEGAWEKSQAELVAEQDRLLARMDELKASRANMQRKFSSETLAVYEDLRLNRRGIAVAKVEKNTCLGCRITLPTNEVQQARSSPKLVFCSSCGRILLATR